MTRMENRGRSLAHVALFFLGCAVILAIAAALPFPRQSPEQEVFIGSLAGAGSLALTLLFVRWDGLQLHHVGAMPNRKSPVFLSAGFAIGVFLVALHSYVVGIVGHVHWERIPGAGFEQGGLVLLGYLLLSGREELAFHGYPLRRLQVVLGVWGAQAIVALIFALEHMGGGWAPAQALWGAAAGSVLFGMASIATRGLAVPIGIHAAWNFGDWLRGNRSVPGLWRAQVDQGFENAASSAGMWCYLAVMAAATLGFWLWHRARESGKAAL